MIPLFKVENNQAVEQAALSVMRSGMIAGGSYVAKFESDLSDVLQQKHIVAMSDMTSAIHALLDLIGVGSGDDVVTTALSCMASNAPIASVGANAVWVDVENESVFVDPVNFENSITPHTKAALIYHVAGYPGKIKEIAAICQRRGIILIEDCNNAMLATVHGQQVGSFGDFAVFSFYPTRLVQTFEGAAVVCRDVKHVDLLIKFRRLGINFSTFRNAIGEINELSDIPNTGWSASMSNIGAAVGCVQLPNARLKMEMIRNNAAYLQDKIEATPFVHCIPALENSEPSFWTMLLWVESKDELLTFMKGKGIHVSSLHLRNDCYSCFSKTSKKALPNTELLQKHILAIPCGWWLSKEDMDYILKMIALWRKA